MGIGDSLMSAGQAKLRHRATGRRIAVGDGTNLRWISFFHNNPYLVQPGQSMIGVEWIVDYPGRRPYIDYEATLARARQYPTHVTRRNKYGGQWVWRTDHKAEPAEFFPTEEELRYRREFVHSRPYVVIEPHVKTKAPPTKKWPLSYYQEVVNEMGRPGSFDFVQFDMGQPILRGVIPIKADFRQACIWLQCARAYLGNEGALHHAAAAVGVPAVVIFGAYIPPSITGYSTHKNFFVDNPRILGLRVKSRASDAALQSIRPEAVMDALAEVA